jgi:penicillin-binding protein 1A
MASKKAKKGGASPMRRWAGALVAASAVGLLALVAAAVLLTPDCADRGCPTLASLQEYRPPEPPRVYDRSGNLFGQLEGPRRLVVPLHDVAPLVQNGFVAVEDRRFFQHRGFDALGIARAVVRNVRSGGVEEGASTITMQLVRNVFEADVLEYNRWRRKLTEVRMALVLEARLPKHRVLELYLNQIYLGGGVWGVETAARDLFGKSVADVSPGEAALLVGLAKNPEGYSPRSHPERARARRDLVLDVFVREGLLGEHEAAEAKAEPLTVVAKPRSREVGAWYLAAVDRRIRELYPEPRARQGLRIHTGYDAVVQEAAREALLEQIAAVEAGRYGAYTHPTPTGDRLDPVAAGGSPYLQGMVVALDATTGAIRALVGGRDPVHSQFDRALQARRQPGSAFKPLVYSAAFERGLTLIDSLDTGPVVVRQAGSPPWSPRDGGDGTRLTVREAVARSSNAAAVRAGQLAGVGAVAARARQLGLSTPVPSYPSVFLGSAEVVPVELAAAYAAFGNGGRRVTPHLIRSIEDRSGRTIWIPDDTAPKPVLDPAVAFLTLEILRGVVDGGTGWPVREAGYSGAAAGKTGTTDGGKDAWFVGLTPEISAAVWLGFDGPRTIVPGAGGGALAAPVWGRIAAAIPAPRETPGWRAPTGVVEVAVDRSTGHVASDYCPGDVVESEIFLAGTEPTVQCPVHREGFLRTVVGGVKKLLGGGD